MPNIKICPYPGLRPFNEEESIFFKGREAHIEKIISQLQEKKFLMVTGASGDGKSSIIYAGLVPRSRAGFFKTRYNNWMLVDFRPERSPLTNLSAALNKHLNFPDANTVEEELSYGFSSLVKLYKESGFYTDTEAKTYLDADENTRQQQKNKSANLLILVDQFEELFTNAENFSNGRPSLQAITLINLIIETTKIAERENLPIYIVCTMRSDYIGDCAAFKGLPELIVYSQFFVPRLKRQEIHRAILEPAKLSGNKIANRLIERLINESGDGLDQLPILQHALNRIWRVHMDDGAVEMDVIHYAKVGGLEGDLLPEEQKEAFVGWYNQQPAFKQQFLEKGSLSNVLNTHARELFELSVDYCKNHIGRSLSREEAQLMLQKIFTCLTKINDGRAVRNRSSVYEIKQIVGDSVDTQLIEGLVNLYRDPENTLLKPFITQERGLKLSDNDILDITHESLIRNWTELVIWTQQEYESVLVLNDFKKQLERWELQKRSSDYLLPIGSLSYFKTWYESAKPTAYLVAKFDSSSLEPEQKLEKGKLFIASAKDFIALSETAIKRKRRAAILITTAVVLVLAGFTYLAYNERNEAVLQQQVANQKTIEAKASEQMALNSEHDALKSRNIALLLKEKAENSEQVAIAAKQQAEKSRLEALKAMGVAEVEKKNAQEQRDVAKGEKSKAEQERIKAEQEKNKAELAELKSRKLKLLSVAQNLALKSTLYKKNKELGAQLAVQAFKFNRENGGIAEDPVIYEGLRNAYSVLDSNKHSLITGMQMETRSMAYADQKLYTIGLDGIIYLQNIEAVKATPITKLTYTSAFNSVFFEKTGSLLVSGHDDFSVCIWKIKGVLNGKDNKVVAPTVLKGHKGVIRASILDSHTNKLMTAGKDSLIIVWNLAGDKPVMEKIIKTSAAVKTLVNISSTEVITAQEDGKIVLTDLVSGEAKIVYKQDGSKPFCLTYNKSKNTLVAGFSDGSLKVFNLNNKQLPLAFKELKVYTTAVEQVVFSDDCSLLAAAAADKTIKLFNYSAFFEKESGNIAATELKNHNSKVKSLLFTSDNKIIAGCTDKSIRIWETSSQKLAEKICKFIKAPMSETDWNVLVGDEIPYEKTCDNIK